MIGALCSQEAAWNPYPTFTELHQTLYRTEPNVYDNFHMPQVSKAL